MKVSSISVIRGIIKLITRVIFGLTEQQSTVIEFWSVTTVVFRPSGDQTITNTRNLMPWQCNFTVPINKNTKKYSFWKRDLHKTHLHWLECSGAADFHLAGGFSLNIWHDFHQILRSIWIGLVHSITCLRRELAGYPSNPDPGHQSTDPSSGIFFPARDPKYVARFFLPQSRKDSNGCIFMLNHLS